MHTKVARRPSTKYTAVCADEACTAQVHPPGNYSTLDMCNTDFRGTRGEHKQHKQVVAQAMHVHIHVETSNFKHRQSPHENKHTDGGHAQRRQVLAQATHSHTTKLNSNTHQNKQLTVDTNSAGRLLPRPKPKPRMLAPSGVSAAALVLNHTPSPKILVPCGLRVKKEWRQQQQQAGRQAA